MSRIPVFYHDHQLRFNPPYEWDKRGYVPHPEIPARIRGIQEGLESTGGFELIRPEHIPLAEIRQIHDPGLLRLYELAQESLQPDNYFYPTYFPKEHQRRSEPDNLHHTGFYCLDTSTPLGHETLASATWSAASAYAAAQHLLAGHSSLAYALTRPPGHHAHKGYFGGYCYFNNAAIAAQCLRTAGRVAIVDIDFHHGDGTQDIYYQDNQVLTISVHADPVDHYPYFSGYANEIGAGAGEDFNLNVPLPSGTDGSSYLKALQEQVVPKLETFDPSFVIVALGLDTYEKDPICDFVLKTGDYQRIGELFAALPWPILVTQEGGYFLPDLAANVLSFFRGLQ